MLEMKNFLDSVINKLDPAEERISKLTTKSRKIPKTRPKEENKNKNKKAQQRPEKPRVLQQYQTV